MEYFLGNSMQDTHSKVDLTQSGLVELSEEDLGNVTGGGFFSKVARIFKGGKKSHRGTASRGVVEGATSGGAELAIGAAGKATGL